MNIYDRLYNPDKSDYGCHAAVEIDGASPRELEIYGLLEKALVKHNVSPEARVLEIGACLGYNHTAHPNYQGIEYASQAVALAKKRFGDTLNVNVGDATNMPEIPSGSVDFLFSFATLEHIPDVEAALAEIYRVLAPNGRAYLAPAWNCRPWTVEKLPQLTYAELPWRKKIGKALIPLREHLLFRMAHSLPRRLWREVALWLRPQRPQNLQFQSLHPNIDLIEKYGHISDDDAFVNLDSHAALTWYRSRGAQTPSHASFWRRIFARGEPIMVQKPEVVAK